MDKNKREEIHEDRINNLLLKRQELETLENIIAEIEKFKQAAEKGTVAMKQVEEILEKFKKQRENDKKNLNKIDGVE